MAWCTRPTSQRPTRSICPRASTPGRWVRRYSRGERPRRPHTVAQTQPPKHGCSDKAVSDKAAWTRLLGQGCLDKPTRFVPPLSAALLATHHLSLATHFSPLNTRWLITYLVVWLAIFSSTRASSTPHGPTPSSSSLSPSCTATYRRSSGPLRPLVLTAHPSPPSPPSFGFSSSIYSPCRCCRFCPRAGR